MTKTSASPSDIPPPPPPPPAQFGVQYNFYHWSSYNVYNHHQPKQKAKDHDEM
jgi:hypothetical protein